MKEPLEVWACPVCHTRVGLYVPAHGRPCCSHIGTPRSAARETLMVLVAPDDGGAAA